MQLSISTLKFRQQMLDKRGIKSNIKTSLFQPNIKATTWPLYVFWRNWSCHQEKKIYSVAYLELTFAGVNALSLRQ